MTNRAAKPCLVCDQPVNGDDWANGERFDSVGCENHWLTEIVAGELAGLLSEVNPPGKRVDMWRWTKEHLRKRIELHNTMLRQATP